MPAAQSFTGVAEAVVTGKVVGVRVDFNVPIVNGTMQDVSRIRAAASTVQFLRQNGAKIVLLSHLGRPNGVYDDKLSNRQLIQMCSAIFGTPVGFVEDLSEEGMAKTVGKMNLAEVVMLENLRFHKGEMENSLEFAGKIGGSLNVYVNDAFSCSHRAHASIDAITHKVARSVAGFSLMKEVNALQNVFQGNNLPKVAVLGGAKISTKIGLLSHLVKNCATICLGGGMANTLLKHRGFNIGQSMHEDNVQESILELYNLCDALGHKIVLPEDVVVINANGGIETKAVADVQEEDKIMDIGNLSVDRIVQEIAECKTLVMNGPLGLYEKEPFHLATEKIIEFATKCTEGGQLEVSVAGGGDLVSCINKYGSGNGFTFVSNAGGAFLEFISGIELPGLTALQKAQERFEAQER